MPQATDPPIVEKPAPRHVDLRVDSNRDGTIAGDADELDEDKWTKDRGAVFLANLDDDEDRCPRSGKDATLPRCNDAADDTVNGADDLQDLAPVKLLPWANAPDGATATIDFDEASTPHVQLFKKTDAGYELWNPAEDTLDQEALKKGQDFFLEATDIVRDADVWSGLADVTIHVKAGGEEKDSDTVRLRVAPVITFHHLLEAEEIFATRMASEPGVSDDFLADLESAVTAAGVPEGLREIKVDDQWTQDFFETGYMSMPAAGGKQHVLYVAYRSANQGRGGGDLLRLAGKFVFTGFRGKDRIGIQQYSARAKPEMDSLNSFGNFETVPPYTLGDERYPLGRVLRGSVKSWYPDPSFTKMVDGQKMQPAIEVDTSWLSVGHIDETMSFVKASSPRGWVMLVNDPALAKKLLDDASKAGHGAVKMFVGKRWGWGQGDADISIDEVLASKEIMSASTEAAAEIDAQLAIVKKATGLTDAEIIRVPYLHWTSFSRSIAFQPGTVNGISLSDSVFGAPDPHGPVIGGKDIMKDHLEKALQAHGVTVKWIENWDLYHVQMGEVHCGSNAVRKVPDVKWWETGR
ncbi:MAG: protein-arginine deiminase [Deltaproteobacteria bacterium]|nr:protein-arginine deiminase [Deltaproteobacteria bacterium]